ANINCTDVFGIVGNNFTFPTQIYHKVTNIVWTKNKHKVAEWEGQNKPTYFKPLENRSVLMENGSLTIFNLTKNDAGSYALWFMDSEGDVHLTFELVVYDSLTEPKIICNASDGKLVINCTADFPGPLDCILKFGDKQQSCQNPLSIPVEDVGTTSSAKCIVKSSQMERSSEIFLHQCLP
ncbi:LFA3 protein, partial [Regulus satrapa]|nr:LFA3 protein [Regulus satrapa]